MFTYKYKDYGIKMISIYDNNIELAYIIYEYVDNTLIIDNIKKTEIANYKYSNEEYHFGTNIFIELIKYLQNIKQINIDRIYGTLSLADALRGNWDFSISFYFHLSQYIYEILHMKYDFHLYNSVNNINEYFLTEDNDIRKIQISNFINDHINNQIDASFAFLKRASL